MVILHSSLPTASDRLFSCAAERPSSPYLSTRMLSPSNGPAAIQTAMCWSSGTAVRCHGCDCLVAMILSFVLRPLLSP
jgi:hypothetical protein